MHARLRVVLLYVACFPQRPAVLKWHQRLPPPTPLTHPSRDTTAAAAVPPAAPPPAPPLRSSVASPPSRGITVAHMWGMTELSPLGSLGTPTAQQLGDGATQQQRIDIKARPAACCW